MLPCHVCFMPIGTIAPPTADLIERFSAIIADVMACVADSALKAAGVPWPVRMLVAPLIRRQIEPAARLAAVSMPPSGIPDRAAAATR
jgi:hypothetical protein